jgi:hypothetical protein
MDTGSKLQGETDPIDVFCIGSDVGCCMSFVFFDIVSRRNIHMYTPNKVEIIRRVVTYK